MDQKNELKAAIEELFMCFDPLRDDAGKLPDRPGNYIVLLRPGGTFPYQERAVRDTLSYGGATHEILYTGISDNLRKRDYRQHFDGTARSSTLRKSLGSLMGLQREMLPGNKYRFVEADEQQLSKWMRRNLLLLYFPNDDTTALEKTLIYYFNPPLNLDKVREKTTFHKLLSYLRNN